MKRPQAILFDLGDTLIHFGRLDRTQVFRAGAAAGHSYLSQQSLPVGSVGNFVQRLVWRGRKALLLSRVSRREIDIWQMFLNTVGRVQQRISPEIWREYILRMYEPLASAGQVDPEAQPVLAALRGAGIKLALLSNTFVPGHAIDAHLEREGLLGLFDARFYSGEIGYKKPSLKLFRHALDALGVKPYAAWHVGDDLVADILGARRAGITAVLRLPPDTPPSTPAAPPGRQRGAPWWWLARPRFAIRELSEITRMLGIACSSNDAV